MFEESLRGVSKGDMYVDDIQLPRLANKFICCQVALSVQVVVDMYFDLTSVGYGHSLDLCGEVFVSCAGEDGG